MANKITSHPYEMNEGEWGLVIANNDLTHAHNIKTSDVLITPENAKDFGLETTTEKKMMKQIQSIERSWYPGKLIQYPFYKSIKPFHLLTKGNNSL